MYDYGHVGKANLKGFTIRKEVKTRTPISQPKGGPRINMVTRPKRSCNACWHPIGQGYTHKHCRLLLNSPNLKQTPFLEAEIVINNW